MQSFSYTFFYGFTLPLLTGLIAPSADQQYLRWRAWVLTGDFRR